MKSARLTGGRSWGSGSTAVITPEYLSLRKSAWKRF